MSQGGSRHNAEKARWESHEHVADPPVGGGGHELVSPRDRDRPSGPTVRHLGRFRWGVVALFLLGACSLAAAVVLTTGGRRSAAIASSGPAWSTWRPPDTGLAAAQEIADFVAPNYRADPADQLAVVTVVNLNNPAAPVQVVVPTSTSGTLLPLPASSTIVYDLCGEGSSNCSIGVGKPSSARLLLLQREALELALYTFKYVSGTQWVVAILPPGYTTQSCTGICVKSKQKPAVKPLDLAVVFDRSELGPWLARPLRSTLSEQLPPSVSKIKSAPEAELVSLLTSHGMFSEATAQAQDGSTEITLSPVRPQ